MNILVTGASSGIGRQLAEDYLAQGHKTYCCGRDGESLQSLTAQYPQLAQSLVFDVTDRQQTDAQLSSLSDLDLVILNAGTCEYMNASQFDAELFERVVRTNLTGVANCLAYLIPNLKAGSRIALMGSSSSYLPLPRAEAYGASKAAIAYLAKTLNISLKQNGIGVSLIAPGFVETPLTRKNDFPMPMAISVERASGYIRKGLDSGKMEIHFPGRFTYLLKFAAVFPYWLQMKVIGKLIPGQ